MADDPLQQRCIRIYSWPKAYSEVVQGKACQNVTFKASNYDQPSNKLPAGNSKLARIMQ
jgi:hypothetical protein